MQKHEQYAARVFLYGSLRGKVLRLELCKVGIHRIKHGQLFRRLVFAVDIDAPGLATKLTAHTHPAPKPVFAHRVILKCPNEVRPPIGVILPEDALTNKGIPD